MNEQPEAAAKAAEAFRKWCGNSYEWDALTDIERQRWIRFSETEYYRIHSGDEQLAALTDKLATVKAEREEWKEKACIFESQVENADAYLEQAKLNVKAEVTALRTRVAELERERDAAAFRDAAQKYLSDFEKEAYDTATKLGWDGPDSGSPHFYLADLCNQFQSELAQARQDADAMRAILAHVIADGKGREFYPTNLDGSKNEWFTAALATQNHTT